MRPHHTSFALPRERSPNETKIEPDRRLEKFENNVLTLKRIIFFPRTQRWRNLTQQSAVGKKMATGTFTYYALRTKTLKERIKTQRKIVSHSNSTRAMLLV